MKYLIATGLLATASAFAQAPIKIGEINSYSAIPQFTQPYKQGWQLAVEQINAQGGLLGRKVEVIARDDAGKPEEALRHAVELTAKEKVDVLAGGFLSNVGLALADRVVVMFAGRVAGEMPAATADERTLGLMMAGATTGATGEAA